MTIARRSLGVDVVPVRDDAPGDVSSSPRGAALPSPGFEQVGVPPWALAAGLLLVLVFAGLVVQTYAGRSFISIVALLTPGPRSEQLAATDGVQAHYVAGATVQVGQTGIGARGQDRAFKPGDTVLVGGTRQLVRIEESGRMTELRAPEGATVRIASLGTWDAGAGALSGATARFGNGAWSVEAPKLTPAGAPLLVPGAPEEELTADFQVMPEPAGRIRRYANAAGAGIRLRPSGRTPSLLIEGRDPLPTLNDVMVTVRATVRVAEGATVELALHDVVDDAGTVLRTVDSRVIADDAEWLTLQVQRRVSFGSPDDRYTIGLQDVRNRDWLEIRDLSVYLGALP